MLHRSRSPVSTVLTLYGAFVVGLGALLVFWTTGPDPQGAGFEPVASLAGPLPLSSASNEQEHDARGARDADAEIARDHRAVLMREPSVDGGPSVEVDALPVGALEVIGRVDRRAAGSRPADGWVAVQRLQGNDLATPFDPSLAIDATLENGVARFTDLPRGVLLIGVRVGSDPPYRRTWVNSRVRGARLEFGLGDAQIHGQVRAADGTAAQGARVWITGRSDTVVAICTADGSYDGGSHFPAGRYTVQVEGHPIASNFPLRTVDLPADSSLEVSFGPGGDLSRWTGRVLAPDGLLVTASDGLPARAVQLVAREDRGRVLDVQIVDGVIDQWFERDVYALRQQAGEDGARSEWRDDPFAPSTHRARQSARGAIDLSSGLVRDVQLEGFVLSGRIEVDGSDFSGTESAFVGLRGQRAFESLRAVASSDGAFRFVGLAPGGYELYWSNGRVASVSIDARGPIAVEVQLDHKHAGD